MISIKGVMEEQERIDRESYQRQCQDFFESLPPGDMQRMARFFAWVLEKAPPSNEPHMFRSGS